MSAGPDAQDGASPSGLAAGDRGARRRGM